MYEAPMARPPPCITDRARRGLLAFRGTGGLSPSPGLSSHGYGWKAAPRVEDGPLRCIKGQRPGQYTCSRRPRLRGCLPPVAETSCSAEREQAPPCPVCDAGRWSCHRRFVHTHPAATVAGARHVPVGRTVLVESVCRQGGTHSGTVATGRGSRGDREGTAGNRGAGLVLEKVGYGSARNSLADTRARRPYDGCAAVARLPKSYATACDLESAHRPLLAYTHTMN